MSDKLTFDEALKSIDEKSDMEPYSGLFLIEIEDAKEIVMKLANTCAPTIEMTQLQYNVLKYYLKNYPLDNFIYDFLEIYDTELSEKDLAQAWLHPETVKVVE